jgi:hypothetical protein
MMPPGGVWRIDRGLFTGVRGIRILRTSSRGGSEKSGTSVDEVRVRWPHEHNGVVGGKEEPLHEVVDGDR